MLSARLLLPFIISDPEQPTELLQQEPLLTVPRSRPFKRSVVITDVEEKKPQDDE